MIRRYANRLREDESAASRFYAAVTAAAFLLSAIILFTVIRGGGGAASPSPAVTDEGAAAQSPAPTAVLGSISTPAPTPTEDAVHPDDGSVSFPLTDAEAGVLLRQALDGRARQAEAAFIAPDTIRARAVLERDAAAELVSEESPSAAALMRALLPETFEAEALMHVELENEGLSFEIGEVTAGGADLSGLLTEELTAQLSNAVSGVLDTAMSEAGGRLTALEIRDGEAIFTLSQD